QNSKSLRQRLAPGTKITASPRDNRAANRRLAAMALFSLASVCPLAPLIFSRLAFGVKKIGDRRPAQDDRFPQNILQPAAHRPRFFPAELGSQPRWMDPGSPQAFIGIDIADAAQHALVQQERLDPRAAPAKPLGEFFLADFERVGAESGQLFGKRRFRQVSDAAKAPRI